MLQISLRAFAAVSLAIGCGWVPIPSLAAEQPSRLMVAGPEEPTPRPPTPDSVGTPGRIRLDSLLALAEAANPRLLSLRSVADAAAWRESEPGTLPDPMVEFGVMNFGLFDFATDMPNSMAPAVKLTQRFPYPGKLELRRETAEYSTRLAGVAVDHAWWELRGQVASNFYDLYSLDRRIDVAEETLALLIDFQSIAKALYATGTGRQADVLRADVEVARLDGELKKMGAMRRASSARLNALLGLAGDKPTGRPELAALPRVVPARDTLLGWADELRPIMRAGRLGIEQAGTRVKLARRDLWPDFTVGLQYGQRPLNGGVRRMASAMVGFSIPIHASSRQYAARSEALATERTAVAELEARRAETEGRIGELLAELERSRSLIDLYSLEILPEARAMVESALSSYRVGAVDFLTLLDSEMTVNRFESEFHQLVADYGKSVALLESTVGRALPASSPLVPEIR